MPIRDTVLQIIAEVADVGDVRVDPDLRLYDTGVIDSLGTVQLIVRFAEQFAIEISPAELDRAAWATPALIVRDIEDRCRQGAGRG